MGFNLFHKRNSHRRMDGEQKGENGALFLVLLIVTAAGPLPLCSHMHRGKEKGAHIEKKKHTLSRHCLFMWLQHTLAARTHTRRALQWN